MAQQTVCRTLRTATAADDVWAMAREFAAPWHPMVDWMERETAPPGQIIRRFGVKGDDTIYRERLTYFSDSDRTFSYVALSGIEGAGRYEARLTVTEEAGETLITWDATIEAGARRAREIALGTAAVFDAGLAALAGAHHDEPEIPAPPKASRIAEQVLSGTARLGISVSPEDVESAPVIALMLHGIGGNRENWRAQLAALGALMPMVALDLRGYGDSSLGSAPSQLDDYFEDILAVMTRFGAKKLVLCGLSYGAWIGASFALRHPDRIAGLVLCGGCTGMSEADPEEREAFRLSREVPLDAGRKPADFAHAVVDVIAGPTASAEVRETLHASMAAIPAATYRDALTCFTDPPERLDFSRAAFPVLLMAGTYDKLAPPAEIRAVSHRFAAGGAPFVRFEEIADAGHVCNLEQPARVNRHLADFLDLFARPASPRADRKARKHARILEAALTEFSQKGFSGASMQRIAERAGVSKPTLYQYVGQKEDIFRAVLDQGRETILAPLSKAQGTQMVRALWNFGWAYADYVLAPGNLAIARLMIGEAGRVPDIVRQFQQNGPDRALAGIVTYLGSQVEAGNLSIEDKEAAAEHLWALVLSGPRNHALHFPQDLPDRAELHRSIRAGLAVFLRAYATRPDVRLRQLEQIASEHLR